MRNLVLFIIIISFFIPIKTISQNVYNDVGHIPVTCQVNWTNAGLLPSNRSGGLLPETPLSADNVYDVTNSLYGAIPNDGLDDYSAVNNALNDAKNAPGVSIIYFPPGMYNINSTIDLSSTDKSNIIFQGDCANNTVLKFTVGKDNYCFNIIGATSGNEVILTSDVSKGSRDLIGEFVSSFVEGDWVRLCENDFDVHYPQSTGIVGQITQLDTAITNGFRMKDEASKTYLTSNNLWVKEVLPIINVGIENLKIERVINEDDDGPGYNLFLKYAVNCWVKGVELYNAYFAQIAIYYSSHIELSGCYIHHARSYGSFEWNGWEWPPFGVDGKGYGLILSHSTTNSLIENNIFRKLRHAMLLGCGTNSNVLTYNYSTESEGYFLENIGDLCLHGRYPYANLIEHNFVEFIEADDTHGLNGPYNAFVRNMVKDHDGIMHKIVLVDAESTSVLGCELRLDETYTPIVTEGNTSLAENLYGIVIENDPPHNTYETGIMIRHSDLAQNWYYYKDYMHLHDFSYYYSQRPVFLDSNYTFPSIGPEFTLQNIPAKDRYNSSNKTYLPDPTPHSYYISGTISQNLALQDNVYITGDVTIASGYTLSFKPGTVVRANANTRITVNGMLKAEGTASQKITFTRSGTSGSWYGIRFEDSSVDADCIVKYWYPLNNLW